MVWFVNNTSPAPGSGTFESPFPTLIQAQDASAPNDIIYVFTGDGTDKGMNAGIMLQKGQQLFGASINHTIKTTMGHVKIPAQVDGITNDLEYKFNFCVNKFQCQFFTI